MVAELLSLICFLGIKMLIWLKRSRCRRTRFFPIHSKKDQETSLKRKDNQSSSTLNGIVLKNGVFEPLGRRNCLVKRFRSRHDLRNMYTICQENLIQGYRTYRLQSIRSHWVSKVHIKACEAKKWKQCENKGTIDFIALNWEKNTRQSICIFQHHFQIWQDF